MKPVRLVTIATMCLAFSAATFGQEAGRAGPGAPTRGGAASSERRLPDIPSTLDETISVALRANPDVVLAEAKLRQAEAELSQVRLKVAREVIALHNEREKQVMAIEQAKLTWERIAQAGGAGAASQTDVLAARFTLQKAQMDLSQLEAGLRYMLASGGASQSGSGHGPDPFSNQLVPAPTAPTPPVTAHRPALPAAMVEGPLSAKISTRFKEAPLSEVLDSLAKSTALSFVVHRSAQEDAALTEAKVTTPFNEPVTLAAFLRMMTDQFDLMFVFREYGVLVTTPMYGESIGGPAIPDTPQLVR